MKTLLVPIDLSATSVNAAHIASKLAWHLNAKIKLCHALSIPAMSIAYVDAWAYDDYSFMEDNMNGELFSLAKDITETELRMNHLDVECLCQVGPLASVVEDVATTDDTLMVVLGISQNDAAKKLVFGSASREIIDNVSYPVLLIPQAYQYNPIERIAFATDLNHGDIAVINSLCQLADQFGAEVLIVHITDEESTVKPQHVADEFLTEVACRCHNTKLEYRAISSTAVEKGLDWLTENGKIDMLVMVHHWHNFFNRMISGSHTKKMANHIQIPLLVYSGQGRTSSLPSF